MVVAGMGAMVTVGYTQARAWGVGQMAGAGTTFGVGAGGVIEVIGGSIASIAGIQNYQGTGNFHVSAGQITFFAQPRYSTQVHRVYSDGVVRDHHPSRIIYYRSDPID